MDALPRGLLAALVVLLVVLPATALAVVAPHDGGSASHGNAVAPSSRSDAGSPGSAAATTPAVTNRTPERLGLPGAPTAAGYVQVSSNLGATLDADTAELRGRFARYRFRERIDRAPNDSVRISMISETIQQARSRAERLREREQTAIRAYANGTTTAAQLLQTLVALGSSARAQQIYLEESVKGAIDTIDGLSLSESSRLRAQINAVKAELGMLRTPLRETVSRALDGQRTPTVVRVSATPDGAVLQLLDDGQYYRETVRLDNHVPGRPPQITTVNEAIDRFSTLYPEAFSRSGGQGFEQFDGFFSTNVEFPMGQIDSFLSGTTANRYREVQQLRLGLLPTNVTTTAEKEGVRLRVRTTDKTNPVRINVTTADGNPVDAEVVVAGRTVGRTGPDGDRWVIVPDGGYDVSVATASVRVNATVP